MFKGFRRKIRCAVKRKYTEYRLIEGKLLRGPRYPTPVYYIESRKPFLWFWYQEWRRVPLFSRGIKSKRLAEEIIHQIITGERAR